MKKFILLFTIALLFIGRNSLAQITVTHTDIIDVGDIIYEALDSVSGSAIQIGSAGANQTWDFSNLQQNEVNSIEHIDPNSTSFGFMYPTSNICADNGSQKIYMNKLSTGVEMVGVDDMPLLNSVTLLPLPLTYNMQYSTGAILALDQTQENPWINDTLAPLISQYQAHTVDSINIQVTFESSYNVDGWGDVIIPMGTFPALRLYVSSTNTQTGYLYCTDTISGTGSNWYPVPQQLQQLFPTETETEYFYQWWSNDPAVKFALVNIDVDEFGNNDGYVQFLTNNSTSIEEREDLEVSIFPVPTTDFVTIELLNNKQVFVQLVDVSGKVVLEESFQNTTQLDMSVFAKGSYYLSLKSEEYSLVKKIIIE